MRTRMSGGVGAGRLILPATRLEILVRNLKTRDLCDSATRTWNMAHVECPLHDTSL